MLFDSPFLQSIHGSGVVTIQKGRRKLTIELGGSAIERQAEDP
jgi:hypothetical protein